MAINQISVFVENKPGRLSAITKLLKEKEIDIRALSIADTKDFGILRLIVNDPDKACKELKEAECTVSLTKVIAIGIADKPGGLSGAMETLANAGISVEYMYAFISKTDSEAYVILRVQNNETASNALAASGFKVLNAEDIYSM